MSYRQIIQAHENIKKCIRPKHICLCTEAMIIYLYTCLIVPGLNGAPGTTGGTGQAGKEGTTGATGGTGKDGQTGATGYSGPRGECR